MSDGQDSGDRTARVLPNHGTSSGDRMLGKTAGAGRERTALSVGPAGLFVNPPDRHFAPVEPRDSAGIRRSGPPDFPNDLWRKRPNLTYGYG